MGVTVTVTGSLPTGIAGEGLMRELGLFAERLIRTRTERGVDVHGAPFQALSPGYAKAKAAAGLSPVADLTVSGRMLNDMAVMDVTERTVSIGFLSAGGTAPRTGRGKKRGSGGQTFIQRSRAVGAADKAFFHTEVGAGSSQVKREFFALSEAEVDQLEEVIDAYLNREAGE